MGVIFICFTQTTMYRLNPFVKIYSRDNNYALYNALSLSTVYVNKEQYNSIIDNPSPELIKDDFFVAADFDSLSYFSNFSPQIGDPSIDVAYFLLTSSCNYRCKYCFVETRMDKEYHSHMNVDIAEKGIQLIMRNLNIENDISIVFYGGEPLLNFDTMKYIVHRVTELNINAHYVIVTNGSIMNEEIIKFFKEHDVQVGISIDGEKAINDTMRIDSNHQGTYEVICNTIETLIKNGISPGISCTLSKHNGNLPLSILQIIDKYGLEGFCYNLPAPNSNIIFTRKEKDLLVTNLLEAERELIRRKILEEKVIDRRLRSFVEKNIWLKDCAAYGQQLVISPQGKVGLCHGLWPDETTKKTSAYYNVDVNYQGKLIDHYNWKEWNSRTPYNMPQCWHCEAISLCGGGCAKNSYIRTGSIWNVDEDICILMKQLIPWIIWTYYDIVQKS